MPELVPGTTNPPRPEPLCELLLERLPGRVAIEETPGQWEYLYTQKRSRPSPGNKLHKKKNHVNGYMKAYGEDYRALNGEIMPQVLALQDDWCKWRECENPLRCWPKAMWSVPCSATGTPCPAYRRLHSMQAEMAAFAVANRSTNQTIVVHFEKGRPSTGVYQAINFCFAKYAPKNFVFINRRAGRRRGRAPPSQGKLHAVRLSEEEHHQDREVVRFTGEIRTFQKRDPPIKKAVRSISGRPFL